MAGLERKYQETLGKLKELQEAEYEWQGFDGFELAEKYYQERLEQLQETLKAIRTTLLQFDPGWNSRERFMEPKIKRTSPHSPKGSGTRALIKVLREGGEPLTVNEIAQRMALELGRPMKRRDQRQSVWSMAYSALQSALKAGYVECLGGKPAKWREVAPNSHSEGRFALR